MELVAAHWGIEVSPKTVEVRQWDNSRVDLIAKGYAIEADWAKTGKVFEAIGQAFYYAQLTNKPPAVLYMIKVGEGYDEKAQWRYVYRGQTACARAKIPAFVVKINVDDKTVESFDD